MELLTLNGPDLCLGSLRRPVFPLASRLTLCFITLRVQPDQKILGSRRIAKSALAGLLIFAWLFIAALAASPALHQYFHNDAADAGHSCTVTLLTHGKFMAAPDAAAPIVFVSLLLFCVPILRTAVFPAFDLRLAPGRAPPRFFSSL